MKAAEFERLYVEHAGPMFAFLAYRCGDRVAAEDLLAETFERALRARRRFDRRRGSEKSWLYAIALNLARDERRRRGSEARAVERLAEGRPDADPGTGLLAVEDRQALAPALATLPSEEREAVALRFGADLTVPEVARLLDEPLTTVEGRVYRAIRKLRRELEAGEPSAAHAAAPAAADPRPAGSRSASR